MRIIVEGWRFLPHSFAIANQFQLLEMLQRSDVELFHRDVPYLRSPWKPVTNLFPETALAALRQIPLPPPHQSADALLRISLPYNLTPGLAKRTCVFCTSEGGIVTKSMLAGMGVSSIAVALDNSDTIIVTPSNWSREGFLRSGADPNRVVIVPLGAQTNIYKPLPTPERTALRQRLGWEGWFIFLNIGIMSDNKGIRPLLKAFAAIVDRYPQARLVLKGAEPLFASRDFLAESAKAVLTEAEAAKVMPRLVYIGQSLSFSEMANLYQAADAYVSPYLAEGFNMPVLEAAACGLPVICTKGGATDDFTHPDFALPIESKVKSLTINQETVFILSPNLQHLIDLMQNVIDTPAIAALARQAGPNFVANRFTWKHVVDQLLEVLVPTQPNIRQ